MSDTDSVSVARLISLVRERPVLWDRQDEVYKNRKLTKQAWAEVCEALIDGYHDLGEYEKAAIGRSIIGKWANLRDNWLRYWRKRQELLRVGSSTKSLKQYVHHDQLLFLSKVYDPAGHQEVEEIQVEVDVLSDPEFESTVEFDETSQNSWSVRKAQLSTPLLPQDQSERHLYFFNSIIPMICDFDDNQMLEFHAGVLECIKRVKHREHRTFQTTHSCCSKEIQESCNDAEGGLLKADGQNDCLNQFNGPFQGKIDPKPDCCHTIINSVIPESTSSSEMPGAAPVTAAKEQKKTVACDKSELVSLKDAIHKLEEISETFKSQFALMEPDLFGHSFSSLLSKLSPKKIQSLKRKMIKKVVREDFKRNKVETAKKCDKNDILDGTLSSCKASMNTFKVTERKMGIVRDKSNTDENQVTPSILRETLETFPQDSK